MRPASLRRRPPKSNAAAEMVAESLRGSPLPQGVEPCPVNQRRFHAPVLSRQGLPGFSQCLDRAGLLTLPVPWQPPNDSCGLTIIRLTMAYSSMTPVVDSTANDQSSDSTVWRNRLIAQTAKHDVSALAHGARQALRKFTKEAGREPQFSLVSSQEGAWPALLEEHLRMVALRFPGSRLVDPRIISILHATSAITMARLDLRSNTIATAMLLVDQSAGNVIYWSPSFNSQYSQLSPGILLLHNILTWARESNLDVDLGPKGLKYKDKYANATYEARHVIDSPRRNIAELALSVCGRFDSMSTDAPD